MVSKYRLTTAIAICEGFASDLRHKDNQKKMMTVFKSAMAKLAVIGQDVRQMVDCSEVVRILKSVHMVP